ncbi:MAG: HTH-type transcriptional activator IlvY [Spirochaetales bacterium]|nr:HTH-type transcriptional activator IlvY [Spirochaetales bacterium]
MDLYSLKLFLHLSESLHFYKTSQACFISPPGLTRVIKRIEEELGELLFERDNRSVVLTPAGSILKKFAQETLVQWQLCKETLAKQKGIITGELKIYCSVTASYKILKPVLKVYQHKFPSVHIMIHTGEAENAMKQISAGNADIAIAARPDALPEKIDFKSVIKTPLVFISAKNFEHGSIEDSPFILPAHGLSRERADRWFVSKNIIPGIYAEISGNEAIIAMVSLGFGIGIVPQLVLDQSSLKDEISILQFTPPLKEYEVGYCRLHKKHYTEAATAFWEMV